MDVRLLDISRYKQLCSLLLLSSPLHSTAIIEVDRSSIVSVPLFVPCISYSSSLNPISITLARLLSPPSIPFDVERVPLQCAVALRLVRLLLPPAVALSQSLWLGSENDGMLGA